ncbi:hypothetical protein LAZ67_X003987 [Cordylochernes scorpioides]|uniref:Uncharacterized protein n=1 Tax=Cordylochernes scorpioides TaxID=51811 RepID=A0ABY6LYN7_9ARAC|nr:hypothetical protein LAZ67_X003987 [Cordylochernes scorpioides]
MLLIFAKVQPHQRVQVTKWGSGTFFMVTVLYLDECVRSGLHGLKVAILIWKMKKDPEFEDEELEARLDEDPKQTQKEL